MESVNTFVDKTSGKVHLLIRYSLPPLKIHESYSKGRRMLLDDYKMLLDGIKTGIICPGEHEYCEALKSKMMTTARKLNTDLEYYKENGEFLTEELKKLYENKPEGSQQTIKTLTDSIKKIDTGIEGLNNFIRDTSLHLVPKIQDNFEKVLKLTPEKFSKLNRIQYNGIITLNGQVVPKTLDLVNGLVFWTFDNYSNLFINRVILRMFLKFYLDTYDFRSQFFGKTKTTMLDVDDLFVVMDSGMNIVTDVTCPRMVSIRNPESPLNFNLDVTLKNTSFGVSFLGKEIINVEVPGAVDPISNLTVEPLPTHLKTIRRKYWIDECMLILNIIIRLALTDRRAPDSKFRNVISLLDERILIIFKEGVVPDKSKIQELIEEVYNSCNVIKPNSEVLDLSIRVLEIILSGEQDEIKENFSVEVRRILEEVLNKEFGTNFDEDR